MRFGADFTRDGLRFAAFSLLALALATCAPAQAGPIPAETVAPTPTVVAVNAPVETPVPVSLTIAPTQSPTALPPTPTPVPDSPTSVRLTDTPIPPTVTPISTSAPGPRLPANTAVPPTGAPEPAIRTPLPPATAAGVPTAPAGVAPLAGNTGGTLAVPAGTIVLSGRERALYAEAIARGRNGGTFAVAGDSNSEWSGYLGQIASGAFDLRSRPVYAAAAARFSASFPRRGVAIAGGLRAADMFVPDWPDKPVLCERAEGRFACELRVTRASIVFIQLGTGDRFVWTEYEGHLRRMIELALASGVLPVLVTKADDLESWQGGAPMDHMNSVVRRLAGEYQLPLIDFFKATRGLPVIPNPQLPDRPFTKNGLLDEWGYYFHLSDQGKEMRILATLAMLAAVAN